MRKYLILFSLCLMCGKANTQDRLVYEIYDKLCNTLQLKTSKRPILEIKSTSSSGASFSKFTNTISLDKKLIEGFSKLKDFQALAIAFVLGHELSHALEKDKHDTHFLAYDKIKGASYQNEQNADIQGAFIAFIAGYNCAPILAEIIETIYKTYQLNSALKGYPDKADRIESVVLVSEQVESLIALFKGANLLLLTDQYQSSRALFTKISTYYPSPECASNIAVTLMLDALNIGAYNYFNYTLPIEISWELRLKKPTLDQGQKDFEPEILRHRELMLKKAELVLKESLELHPDYFKGWNNLICLKLIQNEIAQSGELIKVATSRFKSKVEEEQLRMLQGTAYLIQGNRESAIKYFKGIKSAWLNAAITVNLSASKRAPAATSCIADIKPLNGTISTLLQEKTVKIDSLIVTWSKDRLKIVSPSKSILFSQVQVLNQLNCQPNKSYNDEGIKWSESLISVLNQTDKRRIFYAVQ